MNYSQNFETGLSVSNTLCGKLVLSLDSPNIFDDSFRVASYNFLFQILIFLVVS